MKNYLQGDRCQMLRRGGCNDAANTSIAWYLSISYDPEKTASECIPV